ncbi:hypothetical protein N6H18_14270 [Reichenbachiella agarivorans]|uniref:Uncharacterized protein n=1 Tax=Reichenbachiella agarivorans TaxID=2979464 RepID=A0ABY6CP34_9BACT|nr:hypothetical protein [Reichenbachiella agarivorans]UXP31514.1 hypothetical protein N6H18_14270 [Reichenbachiella agarivorans]
MRIAFIITLAIISFHTSVGQGRLTDDMKETEEQLSASTKQINQFFRRFNGEEDEKGNRYYPSDKNYHDPALRKKYMPVLFDTQTGQVDAALAKSFISKITSKTDPVYLDFHKDDWLAEVNTVFLFKGREIPGTLYMRLQQQGQGYEWVIEDVAFEQFQKLFDKDTSDTKKFLHPMSHELDFMTLRKGLEGNKHAEQFTGRKFEPDYLTIFLYEFNQGNMKFKTVKDVNFHFFSVKGYYFSISNFNRSGYNSGWLISSLVALSSEDEKQQMKNYIYGKN